jgi:hypothetical protein
MEFMNEIKEKRSKINLREYKKIFLCFVFCVFVFCVLCFVGCVLWVCRVWVCRVGVIGSR